MRAAFVESIREGGSFYGSRNERSPFGRGLRERFFALKDSKKSFGE
jgi:hypothetical protein